jgi:hypothetical protein
MVIKIQKNKPSLKFSFLFFKIEDTLPRPSGLYLKIILGSVNVSILDKDAKYNYKDQYEQFKLFVNAIGTTRKIIFFLLFESPITRKQNFKFKFLLYEMPLPALYYKCQ